MRLLPLFLTLILAASAQAQLSTDAAAAPNSSLERILDAALKSSSWPTARNQSDRLTILRDKALGHKSESTPVSDRYVITALAGPIDLVHFFTLARNVSKGQDRRELLYREWQREGGAAVATATADSKSADCTPDDLPSNALGGLFGEETMPHENDLQHDVITSLRQFFAKLEPLPDSVIQSHPHESIVLGLTPESSKEDIRASHHWFTAQPLYLIPIVAPDRAAAIPDPAAALNAAGFVLRIYGNQPILLERVGSREGPPRGISKAVPVVDEPVRPRTQSKAVPVE